MYRACVGWSPVDEGVAVRVVSFVDKLEVMVSLEDVGYCAFQKWLRAPISAFATAIPLGLVSRGGVRLKRELGGSMSMGD